MEYFNNKIICDLIEEKHKGIIAVLVRRLIFILFLQFLLKVIHFVVSKVIHFGSKNRMVIVILK